MGRRTIVDLVFVSVPLPFYLLSLFPQKKKKRGEEEREGLL